MATEISYWYCEGIKEGRADLDKYGIRDITIEDRLSNLNSTIKGFSASSEVGQMLRGERDFWRNQLKKTDHANA